MPERTDFLRQLLPIIERYLEENRDATVPVVEYKDARSLRREIDLSVSEQGSSLETLLPLVETYLRYSVRTGHKEFGNQLYGGFDTAGFVGEMISSLTNTSMYTFEVAPVATLIELTLVEKLISVIGFTEGEGIFCTGGSNANLIGVLCARDRAFPEVKSAGYRGGERPTMFTSDQAHYSYLKAANQLGIGVDNVIAVKTKSNGQMIPEQLKLECRKSRERGETPFFVGATAGTTVLGAFDPLRSIARVCNEHGLWLHVDGSWGGPVALSPRHRHLMDGCDLADSVTWDAHKLMGATLTCAAYLTRHPGTLGRACSASAEAPDYLFHDGDDRAFDLGKNSLQCGRRVDAVKLWLMWKHHGDQGFAARVDRLFELAEYATKKVDLAAHLELAAPTQSLNVCFRYVPDQSCDLNALNLELRERLRREGKHLVNYSHLDRKLVIRLVFANPEVDERDLDRFFDTVAEVGAEIAGASVTVPIGRG